MKSDSFSFKDFYIRRIKEFSRFFNILGLFFPVAFFLLTPLRMTDYLKSVASSTFCFKLLFLSSGDYNSAPSKVTPFINMWSLSLEEQYYLLIPLVFFIIFNKFKNKSQYLFYTLIVISLYFAFSYKSVEPTNYFYLLQYRVWNSSWHYSSTAFFK